MIKNLKGESSINDVLLEKVRNKSARVAVFGAGRVGLPTGVAIGSKGYAITVVDTNKAVIGSLNKGICHINEPRLNDLLKQLCAKDLFNATLNGKEAVMNSDIIILCVPTPVNEFGKPLLSNIENVCATISDNLNSKKLILLESTVPPKTTKNMVATLLENGKYKRGKDFLLAYCPERIIPGRAITEFINNDRILGADDDESASVALEFLGQVIKGKISITDTITAEITKLVENTFRDVNIALANEIALICEQLGADVEDIFQLANTHPRVNLHKAGPGVGGPCLPKDPHLLLSSLKQRQIKSIIATARELNDRMPEHVAELLINEMKRIGKSLESSKIAIFGVAYKGDIDDSRYSPSEKLISIFKNAGAATRVFDPYCSESFGAIKCDSINEAVKDVDCIIIVTDHAIFKNLDLGNIKQLMAPKPIIVDGRRILDPDETRNLGFIYKAIGLGQLQDSLALSREMTQVNITYT